MSRFLQNHQAKVKNGFLLSDRSKKAETVFFFLLILFLPTQLGKHFWPDFSILLGLKVDYLSPTIYFTDILIYLLCIVWLFRNVIQKLESKNSNTKAPNSKQFSKSKNQITKHFEFTNWNLLRIWNFGFWIYLLFLLYLLLNTFLSNNFLNGLYHIVKFLEFSFVAFYISQTIRRKNQLTAIAFLFSIGVMFESVLAFTQFFKQGSVGGLFYYFGERFFNGQSPGIANASINGELILRPYGTFPHPNVLAGYIVVAMTLILFYLPGFTSKKKRIFCITAVLLGSSVLALSLSRTGIAVWFLTLVIVFFRVVFEKIRTVKQRLLLFSLAGVLFLFAGGLFFFSPVSTRFTSVSFAEEAVSQRDQLLGASVAMLKDHPLTGVGFGNFLPVLSLNRQFSAWTSLQPVHNIVLLFVAETGLIGLIFGLWFLGKTYAHLLSGCRTQKDLQLISALCITLITQILLIGMLDHYWLTLQQGQLLLAFILGLCWIKFEK